MGNLHAQAITPGFGQFWAMCRREQWQIWHVSNESSITYRLVKRILPPNPTLTAPDDYTGRVCFYPVMK
jgi:hypothetical protein